MCAGEDIALKPSFDIWSAAVIAFEIISQAPAFETLEDALACAQGLQPYAWHADDSLQPQSWRRSKIAPLLLPCLDVDARFRISARKLKAAVGQLV